MDTKVNYTVVGIFVILLGVMLVIFFLWLTSLKHREIYHTYIVYMHEEVSGLGSQAPVRYNGVKVGYVDAVWLNPHDPQSVVLQLQIRQGTPVTTSTIATLMSEGITGIYYVGLKALTSQAPPLLAKPGEKYPVIPSEPSLLVKLSTALEDVTKTFRSLSDSVGKVFDEANRRAIATSLTNIAKSTQVLANNAQNIDASIVSLKNTLGNSETASKRLPIVMAELEATIIAFKQVAANFSTVGRHTDVAMQSISQQLVPSAQQLLDQLNAMSSNLQQITTQLQRNPSILVRGQNPPPPGPGESP